MVDEVVRLKATVIADEALATLQRMEGRLNQFQRNAGRGAQQAVPHWAALRGQIIGVNTALLQSTPAMAGFAQAAARVAMAAGPIAGIATTIAVGVAAAGVAAVAATAKLAQFAKSVVEIKHLGEEAKMTTREVRALNAAAEASGIAPQTAIQSVTNLRKALDGLRLASSPTRQALLQMTGGRGFLRDIMQLEGNPAAQRREVFKLGEELLKQGKRFEAEKVYAAFDMDPAMLRMTQKQFDDFHDSIHEYTDQQKKDVDELWAKWNKVGVKLANIKDQILLPLLPIASQFVDQMLTGLGHVESIVTTIMPAIATGAGVIVAIYGHLGTLVTKMQEFAGIVKSVWDWLNSFPDLIEKAGKAIRDKIWGAVPPPIQIPEGFQPPRFRGGLEGGESTPNMQGSAGEDRLDAELGTVARSDIVADGEGTVEEGTYRALHRFYHDARTLGGGGVGGPGGGGAGGAGGAGGLGGGPGGSQAPGGTGQSSSDDSDQSTSKSDATQADTPANPDTGTERAPGTFGPPAPAGATVNGGPAAGVAGAPAGGQIAPNLLQRAKEMVLKGGKPAEVQAFLRKHGENQNEAWCGHFAAAVVKEAGGTPPKGSATASNWRNWGTEVPAGQAQPGDIAVRKDYSGGRGHVPTGQGGSHVTIVGPGGINPKTGQFEAVGGNQGGVGQHRTGRYQFFRGNAPALAANSDRPATARQEGQTTPAGAQISERQQGDSPAGQANVRTNNPGAQYPSAQARQFGMTGQSVIGGGHKIAHFPTPVHGAASNMALLASKYTGMTVSAAMRKWSGGSRAVPGPGGKPYDPNMVITKEMANDPAFAVPFMKALTSGEGRGKYPLSDAQWQQAHRWALRGGAGGEQALARNAAPGVPAGAVRTDLARAPHPLDRPGPGAPPGAGGGQTPITDQAYLADVERNRNRFITPAARQAGLIDRANANQTAGTPPSSVNVDVRHNGTKATAKADTKGPQFAETKVRNQTQGQPTDEFGATAD